MAAPRMGRWIRPVVTHAESLRTVSLRTQAWMWGVRATPVLYGFFTAMYCVNRSNCSRKSTCLPEGTLP